MRRLFVVAVVGALVACGGGGATPPEGATGAGMALRAGIPSSAPAIRGIVTQVVPGDSIVSRPAAGGADPNAPVACPPSCEPSGPPIRSILIEEIPGAASGGDKSMVRMPASARILRRTAAGFEAAGFTDLGVGQRVSAWFDGPVAESYPSQARGLVVVIEP